MKVLVIGETGREYAFCRMLNEHSESTEVFCTPGTDAISEFCRTVDIFPDQGDELLDLVDKRSIDFTIAGSPVALKHGIVDQFLEAGKAVFGPTHAATRLVFSVDFYRKQLDNIGVPIPSYEEFESVDAALRDLEHREEVPVIRTSPPDSEDSYSRTFYSTSKQEAKSILKQIRREQRTDDSFRLVVEEVPKGARVSVAALCGEEQIVMFPPVRSYKSLYVGGRGSRTEGMGGFCPCDAVGQKEMDTIIKDILIPARYALSASDLSYCGILQAEIVLSRSGPKLMELQPQFGEVEAQVFAAHSKEGLLPYFRKAVGGSLEEIERISWHAGYSICSVAVSDGYPEEYETGYKISGLPEVRDEAGTFLCHMGTRKMDEAYVTDGGRVLGVTSRGQDKMETRANLYKTLEKLDFQGVHFRRDIGGENE